MSRYYRNENYRKDYRQDNYRQDNYRQDNYRQDNYRRDRYGQNDNYRRHGGGGGGRYGGGGGYAGNKRRRDDDAQSSGSAKQHFITMLMGMGDRSTRDDDREPISVEKDIESVAKACVRDVRSQSDWLISSLLDCAVELPTKTPHYAALIGLINVDEPEFVSKFIEKANDEFNTVLADPNKKDRARLLLRLFGCLVVSNVLHPSAVVSILEGLLDTANDVASSGVDTSGCTWQPWTDFLVYLAVAALPWAGGELVQSAPTEMSRVMESVEKYMEARPMKDSPDLCPFRRPLDDTDLAAGSDSGGASFLGQLWAATKECAEAGWEVASIPRVYTALEAQLAAGQPHELPHIQIPLAPPGVTPEDSPTDVAAQLLESFPPRGGIKLLNAIHSGEQPAIERFIAEEYILDIISAFDGFRAEGVMRLAKGLPVSFKWEELAAETIFSQILCLPKPRFPPLAYANIMASLCQVVPSFPRAMSSCVRQLFNRMYTMDPILIQRLAEWLAWHLSNFGLIWPWDKWAHVAEAPESDAQRHFCSLLLCKLLRLSYWDRVTALANLPKSFHVMLGPEPEFKFLPGELPPAPPPPAPPAAPPIAPKPTEEPAIGEENGNKEKAADGDDNADAEDKAANGDGEPKEPDVDMQDAADKAASTEGIEEPKEADMQAEPAQPAEPEVSPEEKLFGESVQNVARKIREVKDQWEQLREWLLENQLEQELGGPQQLLKVVFRALLVAGSKTFSHLHIVIGRFQQLLQELLEAAGQDSTTQLLDLCTAAWVNSPLRVILAIKSLLTFKVVGPGVAIDWLFEKGWLQQVSDGIHFSIAHEVLYNSVDWAVGASKEARQDVVAAQTALRKAQEAEERLKKLKQGTDEDIMKLEAELEELDARMQADESKEMEADDSAEKDKEKEDERTSEGAEPRPGKSTRDTTERQHVNQRLEYFRSQQPGILSRLEEVANRVKDAEAKLERARDWADKASAILLPTLMQAYLGFSRMLSQSCMEDDEDTENAEEKKLNPIQDMLISQLQAFIRTYLQLSSPLLVELLDNIFSAESTHPAVRQAVLLSFSRLVLPLQADAEDGDEPGEGERGADEERMVDEEGGAQEDEGEEDGMEADEGEEREQEAGNEDNPELQLEDGAEELEGLE